MELLPFFTLVAGAWQPLLAQLSLPWLLVYLPWLMPFPPFSLLSFPPSFPWEDLRAERCLGGICYRKKIYYIFLSAGEMNLS